MSTVTPFVLEAPFEFGGASYTKFDLRRPKVLDVRRFVEDANKGTELEAIEKLVAQLAGVAPQVVAQIDFEDFAPMRKYITDFLKKMAND